MVPLVGISGPRHEKTCLRGFANNKGADQPAHPYRLISAFAVHFLLSIISRLAASEISIFSLVSVAEETGLSLALWQTPEDRFSRNEAHLRTIRSLLQSISKLGPIFTSLKVQHSYSKTRLKRPLKKGPKLGFKTNYCLMQVKSIAECSKGSILQYF